MGKPAGIMQTLPQQNDSEGFSAGGMAKSYRVGVGTTRAIICLKMSPIKNR